MSLDLTYETSLRAIDPEWDEFLEKTPGCLYKQSSDWAQFKSLSGWTPVRVFVRKDGAIVGGAQLLEKRLPIALKIAHVPLGPVVRDPDPEVADAVMSRLHKAARSQLVCYLMLEPPPNSPIESRLEKWGYSVTHSMPSESANLILDLGQRADQLLKQMRRTTRNNIRIAEDRGITVREGCEKDLEIFYGLLSATSCRRNFSIPGLSYYQNLWKLFEPRKHIKIFVAEYEGEVLSSLLTIPFGDTVTVMNFVWIGQKTWLRPNELLFWNAIDWSKSNGYRKFSFGGLNLAIAKALLDGDSPPADLVNSNTRFILGFGGTIELVPARVEHVPIPMLNTLVESSDAVLGRYSILNTARKILKF